MDIFHNSIYTSWIYTWNVNSYKLNVNFVRKFFALKKNARKLFWNKVTLWDQWSSGIITLLANQQIDNQKFFF